MDRHGLQSGSANAATPTRPPGRQTDARYADWVHRQTAALAAHGSGVYLGDTDFTQRQDRFLSDDAYRRLGRVRAEHDPSGRFGWYLARDPERLNVHD